MASGELRGSSPSKAPPTGNKRPGTGTWPPETGSAQPRFAAHRTQERRRGLIVGCSLLFVAALIAAAVVVATGSPKSITTLNAAPVTTTTSDLDLRTAKITQDLDGKGCSQQVFDNQTGRMRQSQLPCDATTFDSNG